MTKERKPQCTARIHIPGMFLRGTCSRAAVQDGLCKIHQPEAVAARREASRNRVPQDAISVMLRQLDAEIAALQAENATLKAQLEKQQEAFRRNMQPDWSK